MGVVGFGAGWRDESAPYAAPYAVARFGAINLRKPAR